MNKIIAGILSLLLICALILAIVFALNFSTIKEFSNSLISLTDQNHDSENIIFDFNNVDIFINSTKKLADNKIIKSFLKPEQREFIEAINKVIPEFQTVLNEIIVDEQKWIVIYQNSNEIRPTGGFMGSYSIIEINKGKLISINTEDIYDADGQFTGYFQAPSGVSKYLSSGKGLRLPDANWHVDTTKSAEQILPFYALGNKTNIKGIVFVNLDFAKKLIKFIGPINLPDYNTIITENNIDEVLRSRRDDFFPGSTQKKHMLSQLLTKVRIHILSLNPEMIIRLSNLITDEIQNHNLQFYSINDQIDQVFDKYQMRQEVELKNNTDYIYLVESNVGINKANKLINREVQLKKEDNSLKVSINLTNNNEKPTQSKLSQLTEIVDNHNASDEARVNNHLAYINYQRVLVPQEWELNSINYQNNEIFEYDNEIVEVGNDKFQQIGFLITLLEEESSDLNLSFTTNSQNDSIYIQHQPGLPATKYILEYNQNKQEYTLENNQIINYP